MLKISGVSDLLLNVNGYNEKKRFMNNKVISESEQYNLFKERKC